MHALTYLLIPQLVSAAAVGLRGSNARAAYFLDNNPAGSSIISVKISPKDGTLSSPVRTSTGGYGAHGLPAGAADTLFTQDAVMVSGDYLFTVNAGSDTLAMFSLQDPYHPALIGKPAATLGQFPSAVAYSDRHKTACVINGGAVGGVTCFSVDQFKGLKALGGLRPIALGETTPPSGPPKSASDILFNPSQSVLIVSIKGDGTNPGYIYAYPVKNDGTVSTTPVVSRPSQLALDFSVSFLGSDNRAIVTDPTYGASIVQMSPNYQFTVVDKIVVEGQGAACWSLYSSQTNLAYVIDGAKSNITLVDPGTGAIKGVLVLDAAGGGVLDSQFGGDYMYCLRSGSEISVVYIGGAHGYGAKQVQTFDLSSLGSRTGFQGMATYGCG